MARKTILMAALAAAAALTATPLLAQAAPAAPNCAADPAACQALLDRMAPGADRDDDRREGRRGDRDHHGKRSRGGEARHGHRAPWQSGLTQRFDSNADGTASADEVRAGIAALVTQFDANADQALTVDEFTALHAELMRPMAARSFARIDANADGRIDPAETEAVMQRMAGGPGGDDAPAPQPAPAGDAGAATPASPAAPETAPAD